MIRAYRPLYEPRHPTAHRIAAELSPALLALRTRTLVQDVIEARKVSRTTAMRAVAIARYSA